MTRMFCSYCGIPWQQQDGDGTCLLCHRGVAVERDVERRSFVTAWVGSALSGMLMGGALMYLFMLWIYS